MNSGRQETPRPAAEYAGARADAAFAALCARGFSTVQLQRALRDEYALLWPLETIARERTRQVRAARDWLARPLADEYDALSFCALPLLVRGTHGFKTVTFTAAIGLRMDGSREALSAAPAPSQMILGLRARGLERVYVVTGEDVSALAPAIASAYPHAVFAPGFGALLAAAAPESRAALKRAVCRDERLDIAATPAGHSPGDFADALAPIRNMPLAVRRVAYVYAPPESLVGKLRRRGVNLRTRFSEETAAFDFLALIMKGVSAHWETRATTWLAARRSLFAALGHRRSCE